MRKVAKNQKFQFLQISALCLKTRMSSKVLKNLFVENKWYRRGTSNKCPSDVLRTLWDFKVIKVYKMSQSRRAGLTLLLARLSQALWTTRPRDFYHPNQVSIICIVKSFNFWLTVPLRLVIQMCSLTSLM